MSNDLTNGLTKRLRIVSDMINMGEKISWGEETAIMDQAADEIDRLREALTNARHILRVENLLESWTENVKKIDEALTCEYRDNDAKP